MRFPLVFLLQRRPPALAKLSSLWRRAPDARIIYDKLAKEEVTVPSEAVVMVFLLLLPSVAGRVKFSPLQVQIDICFLVTSAGLFVSCPGWPLLLIWITLG